METAQCIIWIVSVYAGVGAIVAAVFLLIGIDRIDEDARGSYPFRPLLIPGIIVLWPLVLMRWYQLETGCRSCAKAAADKGEADA